MSIPFTLDRDNMIDPETGELKFSFKDKEEDEKPSMTDEEALGKMANNNPAVLAQRYIEIQKWATKVHQENLAREEADAARQREIRELREQFEKGRSTGTEVDLGGDAPATPDPESLFSDPSKLQEFVAQTVRSELGQVKKYVDQAVSGFKPVVETYNTNQRLLEFRARHPDVDKWLPEMKQVAETPQGRSMDIEQIYFAAKKSNPQKAMSSAGLDFSDSQQGEQNKENQQSGSGGSSGVNPGLPETSLQNGAGNGGANPGTPPNNSAQSNNGSSQQSVSADELIRQAAQQQTETGRGTSGGVERRTGGPNDDIRASIDAAMSEVFGGTIADVA